MKRASLILVALVMTTAISSLATGYVKVYKHKSKWTDGVWVEFGPNGTMFCAVTERWGGPDVGFGSFVGVFRATNRTALDYAVAYSSDGFVTFQRLDGSGKTEVTTIWRSKNARMD